MNNHDDILRQALQELKEDEFKDLPKEEEIDYQFSRDFHRVSKKLIRKDKTGSSHPVLKQIAKVAVIILILFFAAAGLNKATASRNKVFDFIYKFFKGGIQIELNEKDKLPKYAPEVYTAYELPVIPEGYNETEFSPTKFITITQYELSTHKDGQLYCIDFHQMTGLGSYNVSNSEKYIEELNINGIDVICMEISGNYHCLWIEKEYCFTLDYPTTLGKEYIYEVVGNLKVRQLTEDEMSSIQNMP